MAKKVISTLKTGKGKDFSKVIAMVKSKQSGTYGFKQQVVHNDHLKEYIDKVQSKS